MYGMFMDHIQIVLNTTGKVREETLHGRSYVVAPGTLLVPGVLPGSQGPLYYPADEVGKDPHVWNGVPLVARHPVVNNVPVSARNPLVLAQQGLGFVFNTAFDGKLRTEYWFDTELTIAFDATLEAEHKLLPRLRSGTPIEMSTGLFTTNEAAPEGSSYNGAAYVATARGYRPDHVAVLPDEVGACSLDDGCGILINEKTKEGGALGIIKRIAQALGILKAPTTNELSHGDVRDALTTALRTQFKQSDPGCWVCEVYDDYFIYEQGDRSYRMEYTTTDTGVQLSGDPTPVLRQVQYITVPSSESEGSVPLTTNQRKAAITFLTTNCACWKDPQHQAVLNNLTDDQLVQLEAGAKVPPVAPAPDPTVLLPQGFTVQQMDQLAGLVAERLKASMTVAATTPVAAPVTTNEYLASAPAEVRDALQTSLKITQDHRGRLLEQLVANVADDTVKKAHLDRLGKKDTAELEYLVGLLPAPTFTFGGAPTNPVYVGGSGAPPTTNQHAEDPEVLVAPSLDYAEMAREHRRQPSS